MLIEVADLIQFGLFASVAVLLWEQHLQRKILERFSEGMIELIDKHNELADAFVELEEDVEEIEGAIQ
jgi:hypothetical protein